MARAIFCILPESTSLDCLLDSLTQHGVAPENISYLSIQSATQHRTESAGARTEGYNPASATRIIATGHLKWALDGSTVAGRAPAVSRALRAMGMPDFEARHYEALARDGKVLLSIYCQDITQFKLAKTHLQKIGAEEIASSGEPETPRQHPPNIQKIH